MGGNPLDRRNEPVAAAWQGLNVAGIICGIAEGVPQFVHGGVQAVIKIDKGVAGPELGAEFLPGHQFSGPRNHDGQNLERLTNQLDL